MCGQCIDECPTGTIEIEKKGFRVQVGGKLGRHPQLAVELPGIFNKNKVIDIIAQCISLYKKHSKNGERLGSFIKKTDLNAIINYTSL